MAFYTIWQINNQMVNSPFVSSRTMSGLRLTLALSVQESNADLTPFQVFRYRFSGFPPQADQGEETKKLKADT
jgi:hypothetical protein